MRVAEKQERESGASRSGCITQKGGALTRKEDIPKKKTICTTANKKKGRKMEE